MLDYINNMLCRYNVLAPFVMLIHVISWFLFTLQGWITMAVIIVPILLIGWIAGPPEPGSAYRHHINSRLTREENQIMRELADERRIRQQEYWGTR